MFLLNERDGEIEVDHRYSPGFNSTFAEGTCIRMRTVGCVHCGGVQIMRPERTRERGYCPSCNAYICDACVLARMDPDWVHQSFMEIAEKIASGKYHYIGPIHKARLIPIEQLGALYSP